MNIKLWRVLLFVLIIIGMTVLIYPFPRDMVPLYLKSGKIIKASDLITELLEKDPYDLELLSISSDVFLVRGLPDQAIESLNNVLKLDPEDKEALEKLVQVYEWNVMPQQALHTWEKIARIQTKREKPLEKLVMYYRYFDMLPQEVGAILSLNDLQADRPFVDFFMEKLNWEIKRLGAELPANGDDPYLNYMIRGIFVVGEQFKAALEYEPKVNTLQFVIYVLEYFVGMDRVEEGYNFAAKVDDGNGGIQNRLQLVKVLGWGGQYDRALRIAERLYKVSPDNVPLLTEMAWMAQTRTSWSLQRKSLKSW